MSRVAKVLPAAFAALLAAGGACAQDVFINDATVHTAGARGTLQQGDVLVRGGRIAAVGASLAAPAGVTVVEARGRRLTPGLFAGVAPIGLEEVSAEDTTVDSAQNLSGDGNPPEMRPEFDVTVAYNPDSMLVPVARLDGLTFAALPAQPDGGGSLVAGQGGVVRLDGRADAQIGGRQLYVVLGAGAEGFGHSRAAQLMLLEQAVSEARGGVPYGSPHVLLTPAGRRAIAKYLAGGRVLFAADRVADIRQVLAFARRHNLRPAIVGGAEAWKLADQLAAAKVPVLMDPLQNLPGNFDQLGSRLDNAALLHRAGVPVVFSQGDSAAHHARKIRQVAGNAVANGMPWEAALAALTRVPADVFGVGDRVGRIDVGLAADLVLWDGDPLDVTTLAEQVWMGGVAMPMRSRQTELRDRYLRAPAVLPRAYSPER